MRISTLFTIRKSYRGFSLFKELSFPFFFLISLILYSFPYKDAYDLDFETMSFEKSFLEYNGDVFNYFETQRSKASYVFQQLWTALMSQLQQLEDVYREDINLEAFTQKIKQVAPDWNMNLSEIMEMANSIWMQVSNYTARDNHGMIPDNQIKTRHEAASGVIAANAYNAYPINKNNPSWPLTTQERRICIHPTTEYKQFQTTNTNMYITNRIHSRDTNKPTSFVKPLCPIQTHINDTSTSTNVTTNQSNDNKWIDKPKHLEMNPAITTTYKKRITGSHKSNTDSRQPILSDFYPVRGLRNTRSTCYMNSTLQCLSHTLPLREFYVSDEYKQFLNKRGYLSSAFKRVMVELWDSTSQHSVDPYDLRREVKARTDRFPDYRQHDAHEFMRFLLNELHEEINRASVEGRKSPADNETLGEACARHLTWEDSRISELFGGMLRSEVCCSVCSDKSIVYIPFLDIALPILKTTKESSYHIYCSSDPAVQLDTCLEMFTAAETLDGEERPYSNKCNALTKSTKQLTVAKLPRLLIIQLKRFSSNQIRRKLYTPVRFDEIWRLSDVSKKAHIYSLYGVVSHSGGMYGGHYIAYCKYGNDWRCFDDSFTSYRVSWEFVKYQEAYILFYEQVTH